MDLTFGTALSQSGRLLQLTTPLGEHQLQALRVHGVERLGRVPRYTLDVLVQDTEYDPEQLIGQPVSLAVLCDDGSSAQRHGLVESVRYLGSDGGLHDWQLVFAPWFSLLEYRTDCRIWQDKALPAILEAVFALYEQAKGNFRLDLRREYAPLSYVTQFNESDAQFVQRWCELEGIFWYVEHTADKHCIVFTDTVDTLPALAPQSVRFHTQSATEKQDGITQWSSGSQLLSGKLHWRSVDYLAHNQPRETVMPALQAASAPQALERYEYQGQYGWQKQDRGDWLSRVQIEQRESQARRVQGQGGVRQMQAGRWFELTDHPLYVRKAAEERQFLLIEVQFFAESNLPMARERREAPGSLAPLFKAVRPEPSALGNVADTLGVNSHGFFLNRFEGQLRSVPFRSPAEHAKPAHPGPQTAVVVTPGGQEVFTDSLNRLCVRFHWDRLSQDGELGSCWLRMMQPSSGPDWGSVHVPRAGEEVVVTFLDNDIDRPLVMGQVYGGHKPAWHSSGLMAGYKSKEVGGGGFNHWVMDDSTGQVRTQLHSSHGHTQLNLGYLIDQRGNNRGALRGTGFELRTDAYGALRAQQGLYLSTWKRSGAQGGQIDASEAQQQLKNSEQRVKTLSDTAQQHNALPMQDGLDSLTQLNRDADVSYGNDDGAPAQGPGEQPRNGGDTAWAIRNGGRGKTPGYQQPLLIASSPADIATATPKSTHLHSGKHLTLSTGEDVSIASGKSLLASVAQGISLFAQNAGARLFAAKGKVELQAQSDAMELTAQQGVKITSTAAGIEIAAQEGILLTSGGGYIRIKDGNIEIHAPGTIDIKGAKKTFSGPTSLSHSYNEMPKTDFADPYVVRKQSTGEPAAGMKVEVTRADGSVMQYVSDAAGKIPLQQSQIAELVKIKVLGKT
ncbi:type VI secretion system Vgr family protein [Pseudomonas viridiflava]|uniref:type VI secretion system Vgr family protein n=3 Tax=Pseudomonas viridiflava TaxID=33069 RepID=UPI001F133A48|nr:type VI secretion system Vgr family protein [Pseudomonas viridiflava]